MKRRGPRRLLLLFALSVIVPAVVLAVLAYRSVEKEKRALGAERENSLRRAALLIRSDLNRILTRLRDEEDRRPWYQYNPFFYEPNTVGKGKAYVRSPIALPPSDPLVEGYFQADPEGELQSPNDPQTLQVEVAQGQRDPAAPQPPPQQVAESERQAGRQSGQADVDDGGRVPPGQRDPQDPRPPPADRQDEQEEQDRQMAAQNVRTQRALDNAGRNLRDEIDQLREPLPQGAKGRFPELAQQNRRQWLSREAVDRNLEAQKKSQQIAEGQLDEVGNAQVSESTGEQLEVEVSPFLFRADADGAVVAYRYVDVPDRSGNFGARPFVRFMQGFTIDTDHLTKSLFPTLVDRYLDVPGGVAALLREGDAAPEGTVVQEDEVAVLPGFRVLVADADEGWVSRRVSRLSLVFLAVAGGLLLVIVGGLTFTVRTVRAELGLARRKSDFVAAVTHELRTPLTGIKMYADMMKAGWVKDEETRNEYVGFMAEETDRLARLVNRVLDFARTDKAGRQAAPLRLEPVVREVVRDFGPYLGERGFDLQVDIADDREVLADADAVKQILLNLLENAVKYAGGAEDRTITVSVAPSGDRSLLSVTDHGPGVPAGERDRIFEDFYRPGEELTRTAQGSGIGLALVRRLSEAMGGTADARETPGGGATFRVHFRLA